MSAIVKSPGQIVQRGHFVISLSQCFGTLRQYPTWIESPQMNALLSKLRIAPRLFVSFFVVLLVMAAIAGIALWRLQAGNDIAGYLVNDKLSKQQIAADWLGAVELNGTRAVAIAKSDSLEVGEYFQKQLDDGDRIAAALQEKMQGTAMDSEEKTLFGAVAARRAPRSLL